MRIETIQSNLIEWYLKNQRPLPWRENKNPYFIWISEVMLQQTTVQAVIPFFLRFKNRFPTVQTLAQAPLADVLEMWAGLGYYSRARNLHKAAQEITRLGRFPQTYQELIVLPGFGDYTARAVSSIAFGEAVGVVDGNVIRILSRLYGQGYESWKREDKKTLQEKADELVQSTDSAIVNQAMMELGATVCTPTSPSCTLCPWLRQCQANKLNLISKLPVKKLKRTPEFIAIEMNLIFNDQHIALIENTDLPFLKQMLLPPMKITKLTQKPKKFHFQHSITHYKIFVTTTTNQSRKKDKTFQWHLVDQIKKVNPSSLLLKALKI